MRKMLEDEGCDVAFPVHSDPDLRLLARGSDGQLAEQIFVHGEIDESREYLKDVQSYEVQPAVVVSDSAGKVTQWWSWKSLFQDRSEFDERMSDRDAVRAETTSGCDYDPGLMPISIAQHSIAGASDEDKTWIVNVRPESASLLDAVLADRPFAAREVISIVENERQFVESLAKRGQGPADRRDGCPS